MQLMAGKDTIRVVLGISEEGYEEYKVFSQSWLKEKIITGLQMIRVPEYAGDVHHINYVFIKMLKVLGVEVPKEIKDRYRPGYKEKIDVYESELMRYVNRGDYILRELVEKFKIQVSVL